MDVPVPQLSRSSTSVSSIHSLTLQKGITISVVVMKVVVIVVVAVFCCCFCSMRSMLILIVKN